MSLRNTVRAQSYFGQFASLIALGCLLALLAQGAEAQGALTLSGSPPLVANTSTGAPSASLCEVSCNLSAQPVRVYRISGRPGAAATEADVWYRMGGLFTTGTTVATTGWTYAGSAIGTYPASVFTQIPLNLNVIINPGERVAFGFGFRTTSAIFGSVPSPNFVSDANITINLNCCYATYTAPPVTNPPASPFTVTPTGWGSGTTIYYDLYQQPGDSLQIYDVQTTATGGVAAVGNNTIRAMLRNSGSNPLTGSVTLEYSLDNGVTFLVSQPVPLSAFAPSATMNVDFTAPWVVTSLGATTVVVRQSAATAIGTLGLSRSVTFRPDADVVAIATGLTDPQLGPNPVTISIRNNGNFNLNGQAINVRYTTDGGSTYQTATFTPAALATTNALETYTFTAPWTVATVSPQTLTASIFPVLGGDPDATDSLSRSWTAAGTTGTVVDFPITTTTQSWPFGSTYGHAKFQTYWTPAQLQSYRGDITEFGMSFSSATYGNYRRVRIEMGETTLATLTGTFANNYNVPATGTVPITVYDGRAEIITGGSGQFFRLPLQRPFFYSAVNNLLVTIYVEGTAGVSGGALQFSTTAPTNYRVYGLGTADAATGTTTTGTFAVSVRFQNAVTADSLHVGDIRVSTLQPAVGNNTLVARVYNIGNVTRTSVPLTLEYSTDGGTTWPANQSQPFTPLALPPQGFEDFTFTTQWNVLAAGTYTLAARLSPAVGVYSPVRTRTYSNDADFYAITTSPTVPVAGSSSVVINVRNSGDFSLNGQSLQLRYSINGGATWTNQSFTPTALAARGTLQAFTFTAGTLPATTLTYEAVVGFSTPIAGDTDTGETIARGYGVVNAGGTALSYLGAGTTTTTAPFGNNASAKTQMYWTPALIPGAAGQINGMGLAMSGATTTQFRRLRVEMGETTLATLGTTYASNYNVAAAPATVVYDGSFGITTTAANGVWYIPFTTPFMYGGVNNLLVTIYAETYWFSSGGSTYHTVTTGFNRISNTNGGDVTVGTSDTSAPVHAFFSVNQPQASASLAVQSVAPATTLLAVGPGNIIAATIRNLSTTANTTPFTMEYSTDGGTTWPGTQLCTPSTLGPLGTETFAFASSPLTITAAVATQVHVRINPAVGTIQTTRAHTFRPDVDVVDVVMASGNPAIGPNLVTITVRNTGSFSLNGTSLGLRYSVDGGATWISQTFTPATLNTANSTEVFTFTSNYTLAVPGRVALLGQVFPALVGDPDLLDQATAVYSDAGATGTIVTYTAGTATNTIPMQYQVNGSKHQVVYLPSQIGGQAAIITSFGHTFTVATTSAYSRLRIEMGECDLAALPLQRLGTAFDANYNIPAAPKTTVYDGPAILTTPNANDFWRVALTNPFSYSGQYPLLITIYTNGGATSAPIGTGNVATNWRAYLSNAGDGATATGVDNNIANVLLRMRPPSDPGTSVARVGGPLVADAGTDNLGVTLTATNPSTLTYRVTNVGVVNSLTVSAINVTNAVNCTASLQSGITAAILPQQNATFVVAVTPQAGAYSFNVEVVSNSQVVALQSYTFTASGTGFVNTAPTVGTPLDAASGNVKITEIDLGGTDGIEIQNVTGSPVDVTGWRVAISDSYTVINQVNVLTWDLSGQLAGGQALFRNDAAGTNYWGNNIFWNPGAFPTYAGWAMLLDNNGQVKDFVVWNWPAAQIQGMSVTVGSWTNITIPSNVWTGNGVDTSSTTLNFYQRIGTADANNLSDWQASTAATNTMGATNVGLTLPWVSASALSITGMTPNFTVGTITGQGLSLYVPASDTDTFQSLTMTITAVGGSLTPVQAGFMQTFPYSPAAALGSVGAILTALPTQSGNVLFRVNVVDNGVFPGNANPVFIDVVIGAALYVTDVDVDTPYLRVSGQKDLYRGQTAPVTVALNSTESFAMQLTSLSLAAIDPATSLPISGITFTATNLPLTVNANSTGTVTLSMQVASNAGGAASNQDVRVVVTGGAANNPLNTAQVIFLKVTAPNENSKLFDGPPPAPFLITTTTWGAGTVSSLFYQNLEAVGGTGSYTWSVATTSPAQLPTSLVLSPNGSITSPATVIGTPILADVGTYQILMKATDGVYEASRTYTLFIQASPLDFTPPTLPDATEGTAYSASLQATGGSASYTFSVAASSQHQLPTGLSLSPAGAITGTPQPLTQGTFNITFRVNDGFATDDATATLVVLPGPLLWVGPATMEFRETVQKSVQLLAAGGVAQRTYSVASSSAQALPTGLSVGPATGMVSGAPAASTTGTYNVTFNVSDGVTTLPYTVAITVLNALPFVIQTDVLNVGNALAPYSMQLEAEGGAEAYAWTVLSSTPALPASITLNSATGEFTGTPAFGDAGRYAITVRCTDTALRVLDKNYTLSVLQAGGLKVELTEVSVGTTDAIEITCLGGIGDPGFVDAGGWYISVWKDGNTATSLAWSSFPTGTLLFSGAVVTINGAGTAGGAFPSFNMGTDLALSSSSNFAVALFDRFGNIIDVVSVGNLDVTALMIATASANITAGNWTGNVTAGFDNYSRTAPVETDSGSDWTGSGSGTVGSFNPTLALPALEFVLDGYPAAREGQAFFRQVAAAGGTPPYTYSLTAPAAPWLSINAQTGVLSGTPATADVGAFPVTVTVTDAATVSANSTDTLTILGATANTQHSITLGTASGSTASGTNHAVTVTLSGAAVAVRQFEFRVALTTAELQLANIALGTPASLSNKIAVQWRRDGVNTYTIACFDLDTTPTAIANGTVLTLNFKVVPASGTNATAGTYALTVSEPVAMDAQDTLLTVAATSGSIQLSDYKAQDVNRNGQVNVVDVQLCVNIILQVTQPTYVGQGNANGIGSVNVVDVQNIVNCILTPSTCP